jgi:release factor glutamine methyltransferase
VALAHELPHAEIFATDISAAAIDVAHRNAARHAVSDRVHFMQCDLLDAFLPSPLAPRPSSLFFDLIVSNPPYIALDEAATLPREVREHEPEAALFGGPTGVEVYERLIEQAAALLHTGGNLVVELGYGAADSVRQILVAKGAWANISITNDLAGIPRVLAAELWNGKAETEAGRQGPARSRGGRAHRFVSISIGAGCGLRAAGSDSNRYTVE